MDAGSLAGQGRSLRVAPCFLFARQVRNAAPLFVECVGVLLLLPFRSACVHCASWRRDESRRSLDSVRVAQSGGRIVDRRVDGRRGRPFAEPSPFYLAPRSRARARLLYLLGCVWPGPSAAARSNRAEMDELHFCTWPSSFHPPARLFTWRAMSDERPRYRARRALQIYSFHFQTSTRYASSFFIRRKQPVTGRKRLAPRVGPASSSHRAPPTNS